jgi:hypothetical protein
MQLGMKLSGFTAAFTFADEWVRTHIRMIAYIKALIIGHLAARSVIE